MVSDASQRVSRFCATCGTPRVSHINIIINRIRVDCLTVDPNYLAKLKPPPAAGLSLCDEGSLVLTGRVVVF